MCSCNDSTIHEARTEFSKFDADKRIAIVDGKEMFIGDCCVNLEWAFNIQNHHLIRAIALANDSIYAVIAKQVNDFDVKIFKFELNTQKLTLLYERTRTGTEISGYVQNDLFFLNFKNNGTKQTDVYSILTGEYLENVSSNVVTELQKTKYSVQDQHRVSFTVTNLESSESIVIDAEHLISTQYGDSLLAVSAYPYRSKVCNDKIILTYRVENWSQLIPDGYTFICFVYDFEKNKMIFDSVLYPSDCEGIVIRYNETQANV